MHVHIPWYIIWLGKSFHRYIFDSKLIIRLRKLLYWNLFFGGKVSGIQNILSSIFFQSFRGWSICSSYEQILHHLIGQFLFFRLIFYFQKYKVSNFNLMFHGYIIALSSVWSRAPSFGVMVAQAAARLGNIPGGNVDIVHRSLEASCDGKMVQNCDLPHS